MLSFWENLLVLAVVVGLTVLFLWALNRFWPRESRRMHNDMVGWQLSIVGTIYAVILGFMLYTVWSAYTVADVNVDLEASSAVDLYRLAQGLPAAQRAQLRSEALRYTHVVIDQDWPTMNRDGVPEASMAVSIQMWRTLMSVKAATPNEITAEDHALSELSSLNEHRRNRLLQSKSRLPAVLWCVLVAGGAMTVISACLFGGSSNFLHSVQVSSLALLVALVLLAIADIYRPFQGTVHVSTAAFERALESMREL